ncbi:DUF4388 domain-containing protein [Pseudanabaena sp. FACHB-2040]|nr:DUF4388 domain-containing protein [Pseudanabaena sp. FACHB-2040]
MTLSSSLEGFSLAELFRMVDQGRKTGRLTLYISANSQESKKNPYYVWFRQGRVVAASERLDGQGLASKITEKGWLSHRVMERLEGLCRPETPLGLALKMQGALQSEQLNLLFMAQMQKIWTLFEFGIGQFDLDGKAPLPTTEMTGLSTPAIEVALVGLRTLKHWQALADALPDAESAIQSIMPGKPQARLNALEWQVWEFARGTVSLRDTAKQLNQPIAIIQQAAFRLMLIGLVEEVPLVTSTFPLLTANSELNVLGNATKLSHPVHEERIEEVEKPTVSTSLLQNLVGFLRSRV